MIDKYVAIGMYVFFLVIFALNILMFGYTYRIMNPHFSRGQKIHIYIIRVFNVFMALFIIAMLLFVGHVSGLLADIFRNLWFTRVAQP